MNIRKFKWILAFAGAVVVVLLLRGFAFTSCLIPSTGMENSIFQGETYLSEQMELRIASSFHVALFLSSLVRKSCTATRYCSVQ